MEELYELYEQKVYFIAYSVLNNVQQAEDVVQVTFITLGYFVDEDKMDSLFLDAFHYT